MTNWLLWMVLSRVTGSPILSLLAIAVGYWLLDRFTVRALPDPFRFFARRRRASMLRRTLLANPHDRRARLELAGICLDFRRFGEAIEVLKHNLEAGDDDAETLYTMGVACVGAQHFDRAEVFLEAARERDPKFRHGSIDLAVAKGRLARKEFAGAREALERFLAVRRGTVEGRVMLASALAGAGDAAGAQRLKDEAWREYVTLPGFQRRRERLWAWRAKPERPALYAALAIAAMLVMGLVVRPVVEQAMSAANPPGDTWEDE